MRYGRKVTNDELEEAVVVYFKTVSSNMRRSGHNCYIKPSIPRCYAKDRNQLRIASNVYDVHSSWQKTQLITERKRVNIEHTVTRSYLTSDCDYLPLMAHCHSVVLHSYKALHVRTVSGNNTHREGARPSIVCRCTPQPGKNNSNVDTNQTTLTKSAPVIMTN
jgi:hypothetical protein